jgi:hypothetical protein
MARGSNWLVVDEHVRGRKLNDITSVGDSPHAVDHVGSAGLVITVTETRTVELERSGFLRSFKRKDVATWLRNWPR